MLKQITILLNFIIQLSISGELIPFTVSGNSMMPTLKEGQTVFLDTSVNDCTPFVRGELVAIRFSKRKHLMVKRAIAIPGDSVVISMEDGSINGGILSCLNQLQQSSVLKIQLARYGNIIPDDTYIVLGDNCSASLDSGEYGLISRDQIVGRILVSKIQD